MRKPGLVLLAVVGPATSVAAAWATYHDRQINVACGPVTHGRSVVHDLVETARYKVDELHLDHNGPAHHCKSDCSTHDRSFRYRRIDNSLRAKLRLQSLGNTERAAKNADILADADHAIVLVHFLENGLLQASKKVLGSRFLS